ncbi:hypothetical protein J3459_016517 [Metarhizium acridum]|nr:hypothetical protein J3459_016517 [Metarhizium acridum]
MMDDDTVAWILRWRSSTPEYLNIGTKKFTDKHNHNNPPAAKRARLDREFNTTDTKHSVQGFRDYLPTPSVSTSAPKSLPMASSPAKRLRDESLDEQLSSDLTPRPNRTISTDDRDDFSNLSASSSRASKVTKYSRTSSPTKQILHAELQPTGFGQASFAFDPQPPSLQLLSRKLRKTYLGDGILPLGLVDEMAAFDLPCFFFSDDPSACQRWPKADFIDDIMKSASECELEGKGESSWNMVHGRIFQWLSESSDNERGSLSSEYCTNAALLPEYKPKDAPSKMVDWCLTIRPNRSDQRIIDEIRRMRPGDSINQTDCGLLRKHPIAGSIEVKRQGEQYDAAVLQIGTWHSAQWRSLRWGRNADDESLPNIKFLSGYIIYGHDWQFIPSILDEEGVSRLVRPALQIGDTRTVPGILKLFASLQVLKKDAEETFWPAFRADILGKSA